MPGCPEAAGRPPDLLPLRLLLLRQMGAILEVVDHLCGRGGGRGRGCRGALSPLGDLHALGVQGAGMA